MPRANRYYLPGTTHHLTHRCHNRQFLFRFAIDRDAYRRILWQTKWRRRFVREEMAPGQRHYYFTQSPTLSIIRLHVRKAFLAKPVAGNLAGGSHRLARLYAFDTGFVSHARGWNPLRPDDCGLLWEHLVLEHLQAFLPGLPLHYWRNKTGREVDFVIVRNRDQVDAIECKCDPSGIAT